jgi:hypothetical protein
MNIQEAIQKMLSVQDADIFIDNFCQEKFREHFSEEQRKNTFYKNYRLFEDGKVFVYFEYGDMENYFVVQV